jgi:ABC-2 type transport system permease protein
MFKKYLAVAKSTWQEYFAFRFNLFSEVIGGIILMLVVITLWFAIFEQDEKGLIGGYSLQEMITYLLGAGLLASFLLLSAYGDEINDDISYGGILNLLVKPLNIPLYWLVRDFCRKFLALFLGIIEFAIIFFFFKNFLVGPASFLNLILALIAIIVAVLLHYFIFYIFSIWAFWIEQTWGERFVIRVIMEIAMGSLIPLTLFPGVWKTILSILPFKFMVFFPMQIYLGKMSFSAIGKEFIIALVWLIILGLLSFYIFRKGIKKYSATGG